MSYRCEVCGLIYKYPQCLKRHKSSSHGAPKQIANALFKCSVCGYSCSQKKKFFNHLETSHDFIVSTERMTFETPALFYKWKQEYEKEDQNRFIVSFGNGKVESISKKPIHFVCHRSGRWKPEGKGQRHLKIQGSKKINGYCPARMEVTLGEDDKLHVLLTRSHWGHVGDELAHLSLTKDEKVSIAGQIATKVPFTAILNHIRDDAEKHEALKRLHLITRKDLHNIQTSFNLCSEAVRLKSDAVSVDASVTEVRESSDDSRDEASRGNDCAALKEKLILTLATLSEEVKQMGAPEIEALEKLLLPIQPAIQAIRESQSYKMPFQEVEKSNKRKIDLQHRFFPTRKKTRTVQNVLQKPLREEKNAHMGESTYDNKM